MLILMSLLTISLVDGNGVSLLARDRESRKSHVRPELHSFFVRLSSQANWCILNAALVIKPSPSLQVRSSSQYQSRAMV
jgi:hypothetical protein